MVIYRIYYVMVDKPSKGVSCVWKVLHLVTEMLAALSGIINATQFYILLLAYRHKCPLYSNLYFFRLHESSVEWHNVLAQNVCISLTESKWGKDIYCQYTFTMWLISFISSLILATFFMWSRNGGAGEESDSFVQPWKHVLPSLIVSIIITVLISIAASFLLAGLSEFCKQFEPYLHTSKCNKDMDAYSLPWSKKPLKTYIAIVILRITVPICVLAWIVHTAIFIIRICLAPDFHIQIIKITGISKTVRQKSIPYHKPFPKSYTGIHGSLPSLHNLYFDKVPHPSVVRFYDEIPNKRKKYEKTTKDNNVADNFFNANDDNIYEYTPLKALSFTESSVDINLRHLLEEKPNEDKVGKKVGILEYKSEGNRVIVPPKVVIDKLIGSAGGIKEVPLDITKKLLENNQVGSSRFAKDTDFVPQSNESISMEGQSLDKVTQLFSDMNQDSFFTENISDYKNFAKPISKKDVDVEGNFVESFLKQPANELPKTSSLHKSDIESSKFPKSQDTSNIQHEKPSDKISEVVIPTTIIPSSSLKKHFSSPNISPPSFSSKHSENVTLREVARILSQMDQDPFFSENISEWYKTIPPINPEGIDRIKPVKIKENYFESIPKKLSPIKEEQLEELSTKPSDIKQSLDDSPEKNDPTSSTKKKDLYTFSKLFSDMGHNSFFADKLSQWYENVPPYSNEEVEILTKSEEGLKSVSKILKEELEEELRTKSSAGSLSNPYLETPKHSEPEETKSAIISLDKRDTATTSELLQLFDLVDENNLESDPHLKNDLEQYRDRIPEPIHLSTTFPSIGKKDDSKLPSEMKDQKEISTKSSILNKIPNVIEPIQVNPIISSPLERKHLESNESILSAKDSKLPSTSSELLELFHLVGKNTLGTEKQLKADLEQSRNEIPEEIEPTQPSTSSPFFGQKSDLKSEASKVLSTSKLPSEIKLVKPEEIPTKSPIADKIPEKSESTQSSTSPFFEQKSDLKYEVSELPLIDSKLPSESKPDEIPTKSSIVDKIAEETEPIQVHPITSSYSERKSLQSNKSILSVKDSKLPSTTSELLELFHSVGKNSFETEKRLKTDLKQSRDEIPEEIEPTQPSTSFPFFEKKSDLKSEDSKVLITSNLPSEIKLVKPEEIQTKSSIVDKIPEKTEPIQVYPITSSYPERKSLQSNKSILSVKDSKLPSTTSELLELFHSVGKNSLETEKVLKADLKQSRDEIPEEIEPTRPSTSYPFFGKNSDLKSEVSEHSLIASKLPSESKSVKPEEIPTKSLIVDKIPEKTEPAQPSITSPFFGQKSDLKFEDSQLPLIDSKLPSESKPVKPEEIPTKSSIVDTISEEIEPIQVNPMTSSYPEKKRLKSNESILSAKDSKLPSTTSELLELFHSVGKNSLETEKLLKADLKQSRNDIPEKVEPTQPSTTSPIIGHKNDTKSEVAELPLIDLAAPSESKPVKLEEIPTKSLIVDTIPEVIEPIQVNPITSSYPERKRLESNESILSAKDSKLPSTTSELLELFQSVDKNKLAAEKLLKANLEQSRDEISEEIKQNDIQTPSRTLSESRLREISESEFLKPSTSSPETNRSKFQDRNQHFPFESKLKSTPNTTETKSEEISIKPSKSFLDDDNLATKNRSEPHLRPPENTTPSIPLREDDFTYPEIQLSPTQLPPIAENRPPPLNPNPFYPNRRSPPIRLLPTTVQINQESPRQNHHFTSNRRPPVMEISNPTPPPLFGGHGLLTGFIGQPPHNRHEVPAPELPNLRRTGGLRFNYRTTVTEANNENESDDQQSRDSNENDTRDQRNERRRRT